MKARIFFCSAVASCFVLLASGVAGHADVVASPGVYPAPGGTTFSGSGSAASGVRTVNYSGFDDSAYNQLWWGPVVAASMNGAANTLNSVSISSDGLTATWTGQTYVNGVNYTGYVDLEFVASITSGATWVPAASAGISGPLAVLEIVNENSFSMTQQFLANSGSGYQPFLTVNNAAHPFTSGLALTSVSGQFFYTDPVASAVPETSTWAMLIIGFAGVGFVAHRRRRQTMELDAA